MKMATGFLGAQVPEPQLTVADDGTLLYMPTTERANERLVWATPDGVERDALTLTGVSDGFSLSPDENRIAIALRHMQQSLRDSLPGVDVWIIDLRTGARTQLTNGGQNIRPTWLPGGERVLFSGNGGLYERRADASSPIERVVSDSVLTFNKIAEGRWVNAAQFIVRSYGGMLGHPVSRDIFLYDMKAAARGALALRRVVAGPADETNPRLSPDGRWLAYGSEENGAPEVYLMSFPDGNVRLKVSEGGGNRAQWSPDGRSLYYRANDGVLTVATVKTAPTLSVENRHDVRNVPEHFTDMDYDIARDGRILALRGSDAAVQLVLVRNWFEDLKRSAGK